MSHIIFYDSASPSAVPSGAYALVYVGGRYAWSQGEINRMRRVYRLTEIGEPSLMRQARGVAYEPGALTIEQVVACCHARHSYGHSDFTLYGSLDNLPPAVTALRENARGLPVRLHVADWDGDSNRRPEVEGQAAWAKQYLGNVHGGAYDLNVLYGVDDFQRP